MTSQEETLTLMRQKLQEQAEAIQRDVVVLEPLEQFRQTLSMPTGVSLFLRFLEAELNQENLLALLDVMTINVTLTFTDFFTKDIKNQIHRFVTKFLDAINIEADQLKQLKKECGDILSVDYSDNLYFKQLFSKLESALRTNLLDPFMRFVKGEKEFLNSYSILVRKKAAKINVMDKKSVVLNNFDKWPDNLPQRSPLIIVQDILYYILDQINTQKDVWKVEGYRLDLDMSKFEKTGVPIIFKQKTIEITKISLKDLTDLEKLNFYINLYNIMMIHAALVGIPLGETQNEQADFRKRVKYILDGKEISLADIMNHIQKIFSAQKSATIPEIVQFSLCQVKSNTPQIKVLYGGLDQMDEILKNCKEFLFSNSKFPKDVERISLPYFDFFWRSGKKKRSSKKSIFDIFSPRDFNKEEGRRNSEGSESFKTFSFNKSGIEKGTGLKKSRSHNLIVSTETKLTLTRMGDSEKTKEKGKILSRIKIKGEGDSQGSRKTINPLEFDESIIKEVEGTYEHDLLEPEPIRKSSSDLGFRSQTSLREFDQEVKTPEKTDKKFFNLLNTKERKQSIDTFHSGNSIDSETYEMYFTILDKSLPKQHAEKWKKCKNFVTTFSDWSSTSFVCCLNEKHLKDFRTKYMPQFDLGEE